MTKDSKYIFGFVMCGTTKQLVEIEDLSNKELYWNDKFKKYYHVWVKDGSGVFWFPKEKYFVSYNGETNYILALHSYMGIHNTYRSQL